MSTKTNSEKFLGFVVSGFVSGFGVWSIEQDKIIKNAKMNYSKKKAIYLLKVGGISVILFMSTIDRNE